MMLSRRVSLVFVGVCLSGCTQLFPFEGCATDADCVTGCERRAEACVDAVCSLRQTVTVVAQSLPVGETRWTADKIYRLGGAVVVPPDGVLRIEAGAVVLGELGSAIIVRAGGQLFARGTAEQPIVLTSAKPIGERAPGDWGGVALLGGAPVNKIEPVLEGLTAAQAAGDFRYGEGSDGGCGVLEYVRIEFAGSIVGTGDELNGLTLAGCGAETVVDRVQVHRSADDGVEVFGGGVDLRRIVVTHATDDALDWDEGWVGSAQFVAIARDGRARSDGPSGIEGSGFDTREEHDESRPSAPWIYNATLIDAASAGETALRLKEGTRGRFGRLLLVGWQAMLDVSDDAAGSLLAEGGPWLAGVAWSGVERLGAEGSALPEDGSAPMASDGLSDVVEVDALGVAVDPSGEIDWVPNSAETPPMLPADLPASVDRTAAHHGAFAPGATPWTAGWTCYPRD